MGRHKAKLRIGPAESLADQRARILGLTQVEMARRLGCTQGFLSVVERSLSMPANPKRWAREYRLSVKRFAALADNQFLLPLWRFAESGEAGETVAMPQAGKAETA